MTKADRRRVDSFELWCWRRLQKISWTEKVPNRVVLATASPPMTLEAMALKLKLSYFGHIMRADGMEKSIMLGKIEGTRRRGRQRTRWMDGVIGGMEKGLDELRRETEDRNSWRTSVYWVAKSRSQLNG